MHLRPRPTRPLLSCLLFTVLAACGGQATPLPPSATASSAPTAPAAAPPTPPATPAAPAWVAAARQQIGVTLYYDPAYVRLPYPGGDVPADRGVCTDVIVRALRTQGLDLQRSIHEDMRQHFSLYPSDWGMRAPDRNIDHRRVPNQMRWFQRQGWQQPISAHATDYAPGDIVAWKLRGSGLLHIGIVSDRRSADATPLILHNIGAGTQEDNLLFAHTIIGHYRPTLS